MSFFWLSVSYTDDGIHSAHAQTQGDQNDAETALRYVVTALPGEPLFVIRGRDAIATPVLAEYGRRYAEMDAFYQSDRAFADRERFAAWQTHNAKQTRLADAPK